MKRENILLVAGTLLASTALTTVSFASTIALTTQTNAKAAVLLRTGGTNISAQAFATPAVTTATVGPFNVYVKLAGPIVAAGLTGSISITNASFVSSAATAKAVVFGSGFTIESTVSSSNLCSSVISTPSAILLAACDGSAAVLAGGVADNTATSASTNGFLIESVIINNLTGLATAGGTVSLSNIMTVAGTTVDSQASAVELTSVEGLVVTATAPTTAASIDTSATPSFARLTGSSLSTVLSTVQISTSAAFGTDLSNAISFSNSYSSANLVITSTSLVDDASTSVTIASTAGTKTAAQYAAGFVTFNVTTAAASPYVVNHSFNGTSEIDAAAAGTVTVTFTAPTAGTLGNSINIKAQAAASGVTGALTRNGLTIDFNSIYPSTYAPTYTSYIRVVNTATITGTPTIVITNENTGAVLGTYTAPAAIAGGASAQYSIRDIETALGITASASVLYRARVGGSITGYAQHVIWNQTSGFFTDMSSRRTSVIGSDL